MRRVATRDLVAARENPAATQGDSILAKLIRGRRHVRESEIPPRNKDDEAIGFVWRVLSGTEKQESLGAAVKRFSDLGIPETLRTYTDLEDEITWQVIARAMRNPADPGDDLTPYPKPLGTSDEVREALTVDERDVLMSEYLDLEAEVDPDPALMPEIWHEQIMAALKKSPSEALGICVNMPSRALIGFLISMADQLSISPMPKSGSSNNENSNGSDKPPQPPPTTARSE